MSFHSDKEATLVDIRRSEEMRTKFTVPSTHAYDRLVIITGWQARQNGNLSRVQERLPTVAEQGGTVLARNAYPVPVQVDRMPFVVQNYGQRGQFVSDFGWFKHRANCATV
ncbi:hypothetical protein [Rhizobium sp. WYJ-E13]|uniref:hypothetical protein n=1 Tax=Rhizobium sp. WYJ-E13 TaxID=2849093 RepID=UPI001C1E9F3D|nr:hypothetical protein [Rhizobium sp. WYJ-E13]QWW70550.1 hypothetical protein KQ933_27435 [Rhizobium sp. WYJ-E13]